MFGERNFLELGFTGFLNRAHLTGVEEVEERNEEMRRLIEGYTSGWDDDVLEEIDSFNSSVSSETIEENGMVPNPPHEYDRLDERRYVAEVMDGEIHGRPPFHAVVEEDDTEIRFWGGPVNSGLVTVEGPGMDWDELHETFGDYEMKVSRPVRNVEDPGMRIVEMEVKKGRKMDVNDTRKLSRSELVRKTEFRDKEGKRYTRAERDGRGYNVTVSPENTKITIEDYGPDVENVLNDLSYKLEI